MKSVLFFLFLSVPLFSDSGVIIAQTNQLKNIDNTLNIEATFQIKNVDNITSITGFLNNKSDIFLELSYEMIVFKTAKTGGNISKSMQKGNFSATPQNLTQLAKSTVNLDTQDKLVTLLLIYNNKGEVVAKKRTILKDISKTNTSQNKITNDGIEITGLVVESVKTKMGKDFYDAFYRSYRIRHGQSNKLVEIEELYSLGRNTRIIVTIEDQKVYNVFTRPNEEYMVEAARKALKAVSNHYKKLEQQKNLTVQY